MRRDLRKEFERGLAGKMEVPVTLNALVQTREELMTEIVGRMPDPHRKFLRSIAGGKPKWSRLEVPDVSSLPAVESRMRKLAQLDERERSATVQRTPKKHFEVLAGKVIAWETSAETAVCRALVPARHQVLAKGTSIVVFEEGTIVRARVDKYDTG